MLAINARRCLEMLVVTSYFATIDLVMQPPLQQLYKTKLVLLAVIAVVMGSALLFVAHWIAAQSHLHGLHDLPIADIGSALFTSGLVVIFFEYLDKRDAELRAMQQLRTVLREEAPAIRDAVVAGFAFAPDSLASVAAPEVLDRIVENCLSIQLNDRPLATAVYHDVKMQVLESPRRLHDLRVSITLTPWQGGPATGVGSMFVATISWDYRTTAQPTAMRFACVSRADEYRDLLRDRATDAVWLFERIADLDGASPEAFELIRFSLNGKARPLRRSTRKGGQYYTVTLPQEPGRSSDTETAVSYTYRTLIQRNGHVLHIDLNRPTHGLVVDCAYGGAGVRLVTALPYIATAQRPTIISLPATGPSPSTSVAFDGWVLPGSGVAFVWVLDDELERRGPDRQRRSIQP